jgi:hypothetical protein
MQNEEEVLDAVRVNASTSTCQVAYETGLPHIAVWYTVFEEQLCPYVQLVPGAMVLTSSSATGFYLEL